MNRRDLLKAMSAMGAGAVLAPAWAQEDKYPSQPIRMVCGSTPGALLDSATRLYADKMALELGQPVVVENLAGASSMLAARNVARAKPDGYTLLTAANTLATIPHFSTMAGYGAKDFAPIGEMARSPSVMVVGASSPFQSIADLVAMAKKNPGKITFASGGHGTSSHLPAELFALQAGISVVHVPYKGVAAAVADVSSNLVDFMMATPTSVAGLVDAGRLRILAITANQRSKAFPDVPSFAELGLANATYEVWVGVFAPARLPPAIRQRLGQAMASARADAGVQQKLADMGQYISSIRTPEAFEDFFLSEDAKSAELIRAANIRPAE